MARGVDVEAATARAARPAEDVLEGTLHRLARRAFVREHVDVPGRHGPAVRVGQPGQNRLGIPHGSDEVGELPVAGDPQDDREVTRLGGVHG